MPCNTIKPANSGKTAQLQISAKLLEELIPGPVTKEHILNSKVAVGKLPNRTSEFSLNR